MAKKEVEDVQRLKAEKIKQSEEEMEKISKMTGKEKEMKMKEIQEKMQQSKMKVMENQLKRQKEREERFNNPYVDPDDVTKKEKLKKKYPMPEDKKTVDLNVNADIKENGELKQIEPVKLHSRLKLFGSSSDPNFEWFCYQQLKMDETKIKGLKMLQMQYRADENGLAGVGFVFIVGMASAPQDILFSPHFAGEKAAEMPL